MRHPRLTAVCLAYARAERRDGPIGYAARRADDARGPDPRLAELGDGVRVELRQVPVADGNTGDTGSTGSAVGVAVYRPVSGEPRPVHVHLHGGAFHYGSTRGTDPYARELVAAGFVVVTVEYRLAPEYPWPIPVRDAYAALVWTAERAADLGGLPGQLSVGGSSAGGCLAAAAALMARDLAGPRLAGQLLDTPVLDLTMSTGNSMDRFARGYLLTKQHLRECYDRYAPDAAEQRHPYASPLLAPDLAGLPPAVLLTCEFDPLRDEGEAYGRRLRAAGVPVTSILARRHVHSSVHTELPSAVRYRAEMATALRRVHGVTTTA